MRLAFACGLFCCARGLFGGTPEPYRPGVQVQGTIRVWGSAQMTELTERWEKGFTQFQRAVRFENHLYGAVSAIAGLYTGVADLAISREIWPVETLAFEQVTGYKPSTVDVATGSFDMPTKSSSLDILVHRDNPLRQLTFSQLAAVFSAGGRARTWGDLGLAGVWRDRPVHSYGYQPENAGAQLFAALVFGKSGLWNCNYRGFENAVASNGSRIDAGRQIVDALARDPEGLALANVHYVSAAVKPVAISRDDSEAAVPPSLESVRRRTYPLVRHVYVFQNRKPQETDDAKCREFLRYVLSREGQREVAAEGAYLPLP